MKERVYPKSCFQRCDCCCSVTKSNLTLWPHALQHARLLCLLPSPGACSNSCPLSWWCHPTISSSVTPFSFCLQPFPASGSFPLNQFFESGGQSVGASASASVLPVNIQDGFPLGLMIWSPCCSRDSQESSSTSQFESRDVIAQVESGSPWTEMFIYTMSNSGQNIYLKNEKYLCLERRCWGGQW